MDQIGNSADLQPVRLGKFFQVRTARHGAVFIEYLDNHCRRFLSGQARQVTAGFRMPGAGQHATGLRHQGENMARLYDVLRFGVRLDRRFNGTRPIIGRDTGGDTLGRLDGQGEVGRQLRLIVSHHQWQ